MKKVILGMVFVFATGTMMNANTIISNDSVDCDSYATVTQGIVLMAGISYEDSLRVFDNAYSACVSYNIADLVEIEEPEEITD
jgi:hypothetical protein